MAHVALQYDRKGIVPRFGRKYTQKQFGQMVEPFGAAANHSGVLAAMGVLEMVVARSWNQLDVTLRWLAIQAASTQIGCSWCVDYGYYEGMHDGVDPAKVRASTHWRESDLFDERERAVLEYAEQVTGVSGHASDDVMERLHRHFSDAEIVELAGWVALENFRSRFNAGLGLRSQGFAETCAIPKSQRDDGARTIA